MKENKTYRNRKHRIICPECFHDNGTMRETAEFLTDSPAVTSIEGSYIYSIKAKCQNCGRESDDFILVDDKIGDLIITLNKKGYLTEYSCEGHVGYSDAYIFFVTPLYRKIKAFEKNLPYDWYIDEEDFANGCLIIRSEVEDYYDPDEKYDIKMLEVWADSLPSITTKKDGDNYTILVDLKEINNIEEEEEETGESINDYINRMINDCINRKIEEDKMKTLKEVLNKRYTSAIEFLSGKPEDLSFIPKPINVGPLKDNEKVGKVPEPFDDPYYDFLLQTLKHVTPTPKTVLNRTKAAENLEEMLRSIGLVIVDERENNDE